MAEDRDRTGMKQVDLSDEEVSRRGEKLAELEQSRIDLKKKKATHNRKWNEELIQLEADIAVHTEEVNTRTAWVPAQTDMFDGESDEDEEPKPARRGRRGRRGAAAAVPSEESVGAQ